MLETIAWSQLGDETRAASGFALVGDRANINHAWIHAQRGEIDMAFHQLELAVERRNWVLIATRVDHFLTPLHGDPRFAELVLRLRIPDPRRRAHR